MKNIYECIGEVLTYKELCEILSVKPYTNTTAKKKQMEKWKEFMDFEMIGKKFKIINVFDEPFFQDGRTEKGKFSKHLRNIILSSGCEYQDKKYKLYTERFKLFNNVTDYEPTKEIRVFKTEFDTKISKIFASTIKTMQKEKLIYYSEVYYIKEKDKGDIREAEQFEIDIIMALKKKHSDTGFQSALKLAINDFNKIFGYHQTWREHYIKVYKPIECDAEPEVSEFRKNMKQYMIKRMEDLNNNKKKNLQLKDTKELRDYIKRIFII